MRVRPLTSILSHKGRGGRNPKRDDIWSLEIKELFKHTLKSLVLEARVHGIPGPWAKLFGATRWIR